MLDAVDGQRPEGVAQVVEAQRSQPRRVTGGDEPPAQRRRVEMPRDVAREHGVVEARGVAPLAEAREDLCHLGDQGTARARPPLVVVTAPWEKDPSTRTERFSKSTSRQRSATSSPRRRPANAAVRNSAASCSDAAARASA
jgi:hypothetical protein